MKYLHERHNWKLILEARDNRKKIKKFLNYDKVIDWSHELDNNYSVWIANTFKDELIKYIKEDGGFDNKIGKELLTKELLFRILKSGDMNTNKILNIIAYVKKRSDELLTRLTPKYRYVMDWTRARLRDADVRENLKGLSLEEAWKKSDEWHKSISEGEHIISDEEGSILMSFKDDYYWLDLETNSCGEEGKAMGHCGTTDYGTTLFSLRKNRQPHVTIAFNESENVITQAKGKGNKKPDEKYHKYIVDLLIGNKVRIDGFEYEYNPEDDFQISDLSDELFDKLYHGNKKIFENAKGYTSLMLYNRKLIGKEQVVEAFEDVVIDKESGDLYFTVGDWSDTADLVFEDTNDRRTKGWASEVLNNDADFYHSSDDKFDFGNNWNDLTIDTLNEIKKEIIERQDKEDTIYDDEGEELDVVFTEENLIVDDYVTVYKLLNPDREKVWNEEMFTDKKIGGMYLKTTDGRILDMSDILNENRDSGYMEEIVGALNNAANDSYRWSLESAWWNKITDMVVDHLAADADEKNKERYKFFGENSILGFKLDTAHVLKLIEESEEGESMNEKNISTIYERSSDWDGNKDNKKISYIDEGGIYGDVSENINETIINALDNL